MSAGTYKNNDSAGLNFQHHDPWHKNTQGRAFRGQRSAFSRLLVAHRTRWQVFYHSITLRTKWLPRVPSWRRPQTYLHWHLEDEQHWDLLQPAFSPDKQLQHKIVPVFGRLEAIELPLPSKFGSAHDLQQLDGNKNIDLWIPERSGAQWRQPRYFGKEGVPLASVAWRSCHPLSCLYGLREFRVEGRSQRNPGGCQGPRLFQVLHCTIPDKACLRGVAALNN